MIYNNLKGRIVDIAFDPGEIQFDVELDRPLTEFDVVGGELEWVEGSTVRFSVYDYDTSDEDDDSLNTSVPFQVAYAVSIHKAQGLEYDSVKIVITDANEDDITHSIFYTAVTRAREHLQDLLDTRDPAGCAQEPSAEYEPKGRRSAVEPPWPHARCRIPARFVSRRSTQPGTRYSVAADSEPSRAPARPVRFCSRRRGESIGPHPTLDCTRGDCPRQRCFRPC